MAIISDAMVEGLRVFEHHKEVSESNVTDALDGTLYHVTAKRLLAAGLIEEDGRDDHYRPRFLIAADGVDLLRIANRIQGLPYQLARERT